MKWIVVCKSYSPLWKHYSIALFIVLLHSPLCMICSLLASQVWFWSLNWSSMSLPHSSHGICSQIHNDVDFIVHRKLAFLEFRERCRRTTYLQSNLTIQQLVQMRAVWRGALFHSKCKVNCHFLSHTDLLENASLLMKSSSLTNQWNHILTLNKPRNNSRLSGSLLGRILSQWFGKQWSTQIVDW